MKTNRNMAMSALSDLRLLAGVVVVVICASSVMAQSSAEVNAGGLQFNLSNPGARSLGLGGAFTARADDATAAYANPAGLINLSRPEISVETRRWNYTNFYPDRGHGLGPPTQNGLDTVSGVEEGRSRSEVLGVSFLSLVYPSEHWAVAFYRHELGNFRSSARTQGMFFGAGQPPNRIYPSASDLTLRIDSIGAAFSRRIGKRIAVGASVARYQFELRSITDRFYYDSLAPGSLYGPPQYERANVFSTQRQNGRDSAWAWNAGALWNVGSRMSVGAVFKRGTNYAVTVDSIAGPRGVAPGTTEFTRDTRFHVPTSYGIGVVVRPHETLMLSVDWNRVHYSALTRDFVTILDDSDDPRLYRSRNGNEFHFGVEGYAVRKEAFSLIWRVGTWRDPDHRIDYSDPGSPQSLLFRPGTADWHLTGGFGIPIGQNYQLDIAFDHGRRQQVGAVSIVTKWGK